MSSLAFIYCDAGRKEICKCIAHDEASNKGHAWRIVMPKKIILLVVEDDDVQRRQMSRLLSAEGYEVLQAPSGDEAIQMLGEREFDLVLTDRRMPGVDGVSLLNHIRAIYPSLPVAIVTAYPEGMENLKPNAVLVKPFGSEQLVQLVRRLTEESSA